MALSHALLATLSNGYYSGYDLSKQFSGLVGFFWQATQQQIYRELMKLEDQGYLTAEVVLQSKRPAKRMLSITEAGQAYLREWIRTPCSPASIRDNLLVKLFAGHLSDRDTLLQELKHHQAQHQASLDAYRQIEDKYFKNPEKCESIEMLRYLTLLNGIQIETGWLTWCEQAIKMLTDLPADNQFSSQHLGKLTSCITHSIEF
jgi:DNA-binding PadR family transcriptional regulator